MLVIAGQGDRVASDDQCSFCHCHATYSWSPYSGAASVTAGCCDMAGSLVLGLEVGHGTEHLSHVGSHQKQLFSEGEVQIAKDFEYQASVILEECI